MLPGRYLYIDVNGNPIMSVNGSSEDGNCSLVLKKICNEPTTSVLQDGIIPTLTGLDGDMWASQLLTISSSSNITFDFQATRGYVERVEVVMFNCPEWGISVDGITLYESTSTNLATVSPNITSCDSLVRVCISGPVSLERLTLRFQLSSASTWIHLAEVTFYGADPTSPPKNIRNTTSAPITSESDTSTEMSTTNHSMVDPIFIIIPVVVIISIICIIITIMIVFISVRYFSPKYKNNISADIALREGHTTNLGQVMCEETGQIHNSTVQSNMDDPSDQTNQFNDEQNAEPPPAQLLSFQVYGEKKIISTATQEEAPPFAFAVYTQVDKEKRNEGRINESAPTISPEPSFPVNEIYAQVDKKNKKKDKKKSIPPQPCSPVDQLYAQVDKNEKKEKSTPQLEESSSSIDQMYAQVDKTNKKKASKKLEPAPQLEEPSSSIDQLYAQVDKTNKKKARKKLESTPPHMRESFQQMDTQIDEGNTDFLNTDALSVEIGAAVYSVVNKPSPPRVPLKSDLFMEELN